MFPDKYDLIEDYWKLIPDDTDILVTHGPPRGILDECPNGFRAGCDELLKKIQEVKPKFHIFGHIHGNSGSIKVGETEYINASSLGENYKPNNLEIKVRKICV